MKQCPACKTTYTDDSLSFCLSDGNPLVDAADEEETRVRSGAKRPMRVDLSRGPEPAVVALPPSSKSGSSTTWIKVLVAVVILGIAAIAAIGLAGVAYYYNTDGSTPTPTPVTPTPRPTATATPDIEKERLRDELANIQKRLDEQKKNANTWDPNDERGSAVTATVDSPNDGFLALRSQPDADRGERIARIPHGAEVEILNCEKNAVTIGSRTGRWCQVDYKGQTGWVFDAWLEY
jgi:hypothetical protein